jgi:ATP-dependent DNA helicase RecQ
LRRAEQAQMQDYVRLKDDHMGFLIRALDGDPSGVKAPALPLLSPDLDESLVREAGRFPASYQFAH